MRNLPATSSRRSTGSTRRRSVSPSRASFRPEDAHAAEHQHQQAREKLEMIIQKALEKR